MTNIIFHYDGNFDMNDQRMQQTVALMTDPVVRREYLNDPKAAYEDLRVRGMSGHMPALDDDVEIKVIVNTADTYYVVFQEVSAEYLVSEHDLQRVQAADTAGSAGTVSSSSSLGSVCGTISSVGSASTIGTAGTDG